MTRGVSLLVSMLIVATHSLSTEPLAAPVKGVTISTHRGGRDWASDDMVTALKEIKAIGANWVAIHPYGRVGADGSVQTRYDPTASPPPYVTRPIREAKATGLKILIKPHLAYWGSPFSWRGEIAFETEAEWERFWSDYESFIVELASWSRNADAFVIGTELRGTLTQEERWRHLIGRLREVTDAPLTYAANWDDFRDVTFWDALDVIGIQAYFPLTDGTDLSEAAMRRGWERWMGELAAFSLREEKPLVFTELGYNQAYHAPVRPWNYRTDDDGAKTTQELCMRVALESIEKEPAVLGVFLWKWFLPPRRVGRNFQLATPGVERVIRDRWLQ